MRERSRLLEEELRFKMEEESNRHLHTLSIVTTLLVNAGQAKPQSYDPGAGGFLRAPA